MSYNDFLNLETLKSGDISDEWLEDQALKQTSAVEYNKANTEDLVAKFLAETVINGTIFSMSIPDVRKVETKVEGYDAEIEIRDKLIREKSLLRDLDILIFTDIHKPALFFNKKGKGESKTIYNPNQVSLKLTNAGCDVCFEESTEKEVLYTCPHCNGKFCLKCILDNIFVDKDHPNFMCLNCQNELSLSRLYYMIDHSHAAIMDLFNKLAEQAVYRSHQNPDTIMTTIKDLNSMNENKRSLLPIFMNRYKFEPNHDQFESYETRLNLLIGFIEAEHSDVDILMKQVNGKLRTAVINLLNNLECNVFSNGIINNSLIINGYANHIKTLYSQIDPSITVNTNFIQYLLDAQSVDFYVLYLLLDSLELNKRIMNFHVEKMTVDEQMFLESVQQVIIIDDNIQIKLKPRQVFEAINNKLVKQGYNVSIEFLKVIKNLVIKYLFNGDANEIQTLGSFLIDGDTKSAANHIRMAWNDFALRKNIETNHKNILKYIIEDRDSPKDVRNIHKKMLEQCLNISERNYIGRCPCDNCKGCIDENYVCSQCGVQLCSKCYCPKDDGHVCDPNAVEDYKEVLEHSKPCPWCYSRIYKASGCDDMFCSNCHKMFNWVTLKKYYSPRHNPERQFWLDHRDTNLNDEILDVDEGDFEARIFIDSKIVELITRCDPTLATSDTKTLHDLALFIIRLDYFHNNFGDICKKLSDTITVVNLDVMFGKKHNVEIRPTIKLPKPVEDLLSYCFPIYITDKNQKHLQYIVSAAVRHNSSSGSIPIEFGIELYNQLTELNKCYTAVRNKIVYELKWLHIACLKNRNLTYKNVKTNSEFIYHVIKLNDLIEANISPIFKIV